MASDSVQNIVLQLKARGVRLTSSQLKQLNGQMATSKMATAAMGAAIAAATVAIAALAKTVAHAVKVGKEFEQSMANLKSVSGATNMEMLKMEATARKLGASTKFTATEVGGLQTEFAKLGFTTLEIQQVTKATLDLAAATNSDLSQAASVAGETIRGFGLSADQTSRLTDVMAKSFSSTALDMSKFTNSMSYVAPVAKLAGFSIEGTTAMLGQLANAGINGSMAGTALRKIFLELSNENSKLSERLGGSVNSIDELVPALQQLQEEGLTTAEIKDLVGLRATSAFSILLDGATDLETLAEAFENAGGSAERMANIQLDTLDGKLTILNSAWEGFGIAIFDYFEQPLKDATDGLTSFVQSMTAAIEIPMSENLEKQRFEMMGLFNIAKDMSLTEKQRKDAMETLNTEYKQYIPNLLDEKTSLDDIKKAQDSANESLMNGIIIRAQEEKLLSITEKYEDTILSRSNALLEYAAAEVEAEEALKKLEKSSGQAFKTMGDYQIWFTEQSIERAKNDDAQFPNIYDHFSREEIMVNKLITSYMSKGIALGKSNEEYENYEKELQDVTAAYEQLLDLFGVKVDPPPPPTTTTNNQGGGGGDGGVEEDLATKRAKWSEQRINNLYKEAEAQSFAAEAAMKVFTIDENGNQKAHQFTQDEIDLIAQKMDAGLTYVDAVKEALEGVQGVQIFTEESFAADLEQMQTNLDQIQNFVNDAGAIITEYSSRKIAEAKERAQKEIKILGDQQKKEIDDLKKTQAWIKGSEAQKLAMEKQVNDKYEALKKKEEEEANSRMKREFEKQKLAKLANIAMNTADAVMAAMAGSIFSAGLPWTAIAVAMGAAQAAMVMSQKPPTMAEGGLIGGELHESGGTPIMAERGEFIMNRDAVENMGAETLEALNQGSAPSQITFQGNVLSEEFIVEEAIPMIREELRKGTSL